MPKRWKTPRERNYESNRIEKIKEILALHRDELREHFRIKEIDVFGSYVRGEL